MSLTNEAGKFDRAVPLFRREDLSEPEFRVLMQRNQACRISGVTDGWRANEWVDPGDGGVAVDVLGRLFGPRTVPVADCRRSEYGSQPKTDMSMAEYLEYWKGYRRPGICQERWATGRTEGDCFYLKDWHMQRDVPDFVAYETPEYFRSDWLNEYWLGRRAGNDDYRFVYIGPAGSWTPLHCDVFGSYSWSGNVCGRKLWLFLAPGEETYFRDDNGKLAYDVTELDYQRFPRAQEFISRTGGPLRVVQNPGEVIFVPSGWHHQVLNLTDTISINHNWFNGFNVGFVYEKLLAAEAEVRQELDFMRGDEDFERQIQIVLRAHHGMHRQDFQDILEFIAEKRIQQPAAYPLWRFDLERCREYLEGSSWKARIDSFIESS